MKVNIPHTTLFYWILTLLILVVSEIIPTFSRKPIFLAEVGSSHRGGNKAAWIRTGYLGTYKRFPQVKAIMYLDSDQPHKAQSHPDWRLVKPWDGSAVRAYRSVANSWRFKGRIR